MMSGDEIRKLRKAKGWTQQELADKVGVTKTTVLDWEKGRYFPEGKNVIALASALGISVSTLMGETDEPAPPKTGDTKKSVPEETDFANAHYDPDEILVPVYQMISVCAWRAFRTRSLSGTRWMAKGSFRGRDDPWTP